MVEIYSNPERDQWETLQQRCRRQDADITATVSAIISEVAQGGDAALRGIMQRIDGYAPESLQLTADRIDALSAAVTPQVRSAIEQAMRNISRFHQAQMPRPVEVEVMPGVRCLQRAVPIRRVGLYIPGGKAPLFSTVLMLALPAKIAGCAEIILCTPADRTGRVAPEIVCAATLCGVDRIYTIGGAQAIAAMAYGTESVPKVDKIFGPGNRYVTRAKQLVAMRQVAIDMPAGPSEVMVMADATARPAFVAADFLSQAEHGDDSQALLLCDSEALARQVADEIERQTEALGRCQIVQKALDNSRIIVFDGDDWRQRMLDFANGYAPEHLIISLADPWAMADGVTSAGSVFIGNYSPESAGDYASGTNHTLPTGGWGKVFSGVNIDSYMHKITYQCLTPDGLATLAPTITAMAMAEGLDAHAAAVEIRLKPE